MKGIGYLISIVSVILLAAVAWQGAARDPAMQLCLIAGGGASILGMVLRWLAWRRETRSR